MNEKDFQYILTVAQCGSFSRAAETLYVSQPSLSRYISTLEKRLGTTLFDRGTTPVQLTAAGTIFCNYGKKILNLETALYRELQEQNALEERILRVGVPHISGDYILSRILPRMTKKYPFLRIDPISDYSYNLYHQLAAQKIDIACVAAPNTDPSIMVELLLYEPVLLIGAKSHPALENYDITHVDIEHPIFINVSELNDIPMIQYKNSYAEAALRQKSYAPKSVIKASSAPLALELAAKDVGFTSVIRSQLKYGRLIITQSLCPISIGDCKLPIYLAYNKLADKAIPEINRFIQEVKEEYCDASGL